MSMHAENRQQLHHPRAAALRTRNIRDLQTRTEPFLELMITFPALIFIDRHVAGSKYEESPLQGSVRTRFQRHGRHGAGSGIRTRDPQLGKLTLYH